MGNCFLSSHRPAGKRGGLGNFASSHLKSSKTATSRIMEKDEESTPRLARQRLPNKEMALISLKLVSVWPEIRKRVKAGITKICASKQNLHCDRKPIKGAILPQKEQNKASQKTLLPFQSAKYNLISRTTDRNHARLHIWQNHASNRHKFGRQDRPQGPDSTGGRRIRLLQVIER